MAVSLERLARNQALFREVNERLLELADGEPDRRLDFLCECSHNDCAATIELTLTEYERVRRRPTLFVLVAGHDIDEIEDVVEEHPTFVVVQKKAATKFAIETDPRGRGRDA